MKASRIAAVVSLSCLAGSGWLLTEAYPSEIGFPFAGCIHFAAIAFLALPFARWNGWTWKMFASIAAAGMVIFVLPGLLGVLTAGAVSGSASVAVFCAIPLMVVLGSAWSGAEPGMALMMPCLAGLFGALLIFSVALPRSVRGALGLAAVVAGCAAISAASMWSFQLLRGVGIAAAVAVVGITGSVVLGGYGWVAGWPQMSFRMLGLEVIRCVVFDLPAVWMTLWLMREVPPTRLASRYFVVPVVTWLESYAMVRGPVEVRSCVALLLMVAAAAMLGLNDVSDEVPGLRLR